MANGMSQDRAAPIFCAGEEVGKMEPTKAPAILCIFHGNFSTAYFIIFHVL